MKTQIKILILLVFTAFFLNSCFFDVFEEGNGDVVEETRNIPDFTEISSSGSFYVYYEYAEESEVTVSCESNLMRYIETAVFDNELKIRTPNTVNLRPHETIEVYVKGPYVDRLHLSGSGLISTDAIESDLLDISLSGSGNIETTFYGKDFYSKTTGSGKIKAHIECDYAEIVITGSGDAYLDGIADDTKYRISGSGKVWASDLENLTSEISISGSGDLYLYILEYFDVHISGSGDIHYYGNPDYDSSISGSGRIISEN